MRAVDLVFPEPASRCAPAADRQVPAGSRRRRHGHALRSAGRCTGMVTRFFVEVSLTALRRGDGYIINAFVRDITQKRIAEEQLIQAQKMESVGQLTGGIAHDFNNMLTVITGTIEILADGVKDTPHLATITKLIGEAADRGAQLTAEPVVVRPQAAVAAGRDRRQRADWRSRSVAVAGSRQADRNRDRARARDVWPAFVDRGQLSAALVNLAINARDAMSGRRKADLCDRQYQIGRSRGGGPRRRTCRRLCSHRSERHRRRHCAVPSRADFRSVLFHQGGRPGDRARAQHGVWLRQAVGRQRRRAERGRPRHDVPDLSAQGRQQCASAAGAGPTSCRCRVATKPSCASRTTARSATT